MGLLDSMKRGRSGMTGEDWRRIGRLEAEVEKLHLEWVAYRDELRRLVSRLEKRDERAAKREQLEAEALEPEPTVDAVTAKVLARRKGLRNGVPGQSQG